MTSLLKRIYDNDIVEDTRRGEIDIYICKIDIWLNNNSSINGRTCACQLRMQWGCRAPFQRSSSELRGFADALRNTSGQHEMIILNLTNLSFDFGFEWKSSKWRSCVTSQSSSSSSTSSSVALYFRLNRFLAYSSVYLQRKCKVCLHYNQKSDVQCGAEMHICTFAHSTNRIQNYLSSLIAWQSTDGNLWKIDEFLISKRFMLMYLKHNTAFSKTFSVRCKSQTVKTAFHNGSLIA